MPRAVAIPLLSIVVLAGLGWLAVTERPLPTIPANGAGLEVGLLPEFSNIANAARAAQDWDSLYQSLLPSHQATCTSAQFAALVAQDDALVRRRVDEALLATRDGLSHFVDSPRLDWTTTSIELVRGAIVVTRTVPFEGPGGAIDVGERWAAVGEIDWWLDPPNISRCSAARETIEEAAPDSLALDANSFRRPATVGERVEVEYGDVPVGLTLLRAVRGEELPISAGPSRPGFEQVFVEVRVETLDRSQLRAPVRFQAASVDAAYYATSDRRGLRTCDGTAGSGVVCQTYQGIVEVAVDDHGAKLAWVPSSPSELGQGRAWFALPPGAKDGNPVVDVVSPAVALATLDPSLVPTGWDTDITRRTVPASEILATGTRRDGIPAIRAPLSETVAEANEWLPDREPVQVVEVNGEVRAYPLRIVISHEIVNDNLGGEPVLVTYCPLCNTALAFERIVGTRVPVFSTTGLLRFSNLVMYDDRSESWWQQSTGEAIVGEFAGSKLTPIPSRLTSWRNFKESHPNGSVLSQTTGFDRDYGINLYLQYDSNEAAPNFGVAADRRLPPFERVLGVRLGDEALAFSFDALADAGVASATLAGVEIVAFYEPGTVSAVDSFLIAASREVGSAAVYVAEVDGQALTFRYDGRVFDNETSSEWDLLGNAIDGPLEGSALAPVVQDNSFWFSWSIFNPDTRVYDKP